MTRDKLLIKHNHLIHNLMIWGRVVATEYETDPGLVKVKLGTEEETHDTIFLPWLRRRGGKDWEWWAPEVGGQVLILAPSGNVNRGVIIGSLPYHREAGESEGSKEEEFNSLTPKAKRVSGDPPEEPADSETTTEENNKDKDEPTSHIIHYEDQTEISYDKIKHIWEAKFLDPQTLHLMADAAEEKEQIGVKILRKPVEPASGGAGDDSTKSEEEEETPPALQFWLDAELDKENIKLQVRDTINFHLDGTPEQESVQLNIKESVHAHLNAKPEEESIEFALTEKIAFQLDAKAGSEKVIAKVNDVSFHLEGGAGKEEATLNLNNEVKIKADGLGNMSFTGKGVKLELKPDGSLTVNCTQFNVVSSGPVSLTGSTIALNC